MSDNTHNGILMSNNDGSATLFGSTSQESVHNAIFLANADGTATEYANTSGGSSPSQASISLSTNSVTLTAAQPTATVTVTTDNPDGRVIAESSDNSVATTSVSGNTVTVTGVSSGSASVDTFVTGGTMFNSNTETVSVSAEFSTYLDDWLTAGGLTPSSYADLDAVLADEVALRRLFTIHASVDSLVDNASSINSADLTKLFSNDYVAKWINLRDYALDTLYADSTIKDYMDTADKYFYGEWVITDSTTTPPTWGPKGNVPVMTGNTAPYGEAFVKLQYSTYYPYYLFDGNDSTYCVDNTGAYSGQYFGYKFTNPVCVRKIYHSSEKSGGRILTYKIQYSDDNSTWNDATEALTFNDSGEYASVPDNGYHLYWRLLAVNCNNYPIGLSKLQFYGRELKVSVPTMTSNTSPYGEASANLPVISGNPLYYSYDKTGSHSAGISGSSASDIGRFIYKFERPVCIKMVDFKDVHQSFTALVQASFVVQGSNDGTNWVDLSSSITTNNQTPYEAIINLNNTNAYLYYSIKYNHYNYGNGSSTIQFYLCRVNYFGLDYSEYDWDTDNPRHYIYDHGVELNGTITLSGAATKESGNIKLSASGASALLTLNTTAYSLLRGDMGMYGSGTNALKCGSGSVNYTTANLPYNQSLDVSSINGSNATGVTQSSTGVFTTEEMWLE